MRFCASILVILYCLYVFETASSEINEVNFVTLDTIATDYGLSARDEEISNMDILDAWGSGCTCLNGKCVNRCGSSYWTSEGGCIRVEPVCECDPEFGKVNDSACAYCDCGKGINCSFSVIMNEIWMKNCFCPEGYHGGSGYSCLPNCDEKRPCQNGGTCDEASSDGGLRVQPRARIFRLHLQGQIPVLRLQGRDLQTLFLRQRHVQVLRHSRTTMRLCTWISRVQGGVQTMRLRGQRNLRIRPKRLQNLQVQDGIRFQARHLCTMQLWYRSKLKHPCSLDILGVKTCHCPSGSNYTKGVCEDVYLCKVNNPCHPTAICVDLIDKTRCECPKGYAAKQYYPGPGEPCEDVDECLDMSVCAQHKNLQCVNLPGTYKCECLPGFEPKSLDAHSHDTDCKSHKETWMPAGVAILVLLGLFAIGAGLFVYRTRRSRY
ncbi:uncharacterized protein CDAR_368961 [Caerostris darwini]|uniref:EGF-like domain-containing protein n=1 Tax=Caerostris darwini TaxID=1538125 RepID=A0AAV4VPV4_9ARAC|nr:uncharacterized protein CDAR_368961 [Caerostris darwini]